MDHLQWPPLPSVAEALIHHGWTRILSNKGFYRAESQGVTLMLKIDHLLVTGVS